MLNFRMRTPWGTLKIKPEWFLRTHERERQVPMVRLGQNYLIWSPKGRRRRAPAGEAMPSGETD